MIRTLLFLLLISNVQSIVAQRAPQGDNAYVDDQGVLRWSKNNEEIHAFGVNYTAPFAHAYRTATREGISLEKAIDADVYHFTRLGFDAYRVHIWDCEISDTLGNLLDNDHLRLLDYTLAKMKERGMKFILTPIAWWGNGWPEPDDKTPGFSTKYGKGACLTNPEAIKAQENYLYQLLRHMNAYAGKAYKDDPDIIGFEICNEPHHEQSPELVTAFINKMTAAMRRAGCSKPVFYNISHRIQLEDAYFKSDIQGGTFQWYPTGLGARHELSGNLLPNVDRYEIPFANNPGFKNEAKIVYEFDAADVGRSYIYPAMARSFREAGIQIATHFAYDPTFMAASNTEYGTHYMNLAFAPQKALSLKIASEVFHDVPRYKSYGRYPANTRFDGFRVSYEEDLAEYISDKKFFYTNSTVSMPAGWTHLEAIAGSGDSPVVQYEGTGAYFLDKITKGVWRLEVMPDAIWVRDPFEKASPKKIVSVINWRSWPMTVKLPDLGENFSITPVNDGNTGPVKVTGQSFSITPGTYLVRKTGATLQLNGNEKYFHLGVKEFYAPATTLTGTYVVHHPLPELTAGNAYQVSAVVATIAPPESVELVIGEGYKPWVFRMEKTRGYNYSVTIPAQYIKKGFLKYRIAVKEQGKWHTFPSGLEGYPGDWDFYDLQAWELRIAAPEMPFYIFDAERDADQVAKQWIPGWMVVPSDQPAKSELQVNVEHLFQPDPENQQANPVYDYSFRYYCGKIIEGRVTGSVAPQKIVLHGKSLNDKPCKIQLTLVLKDGSAYGGIATVGKETGDYSISLSDLKPVPAVSLPRPYPTFLSYFTGVPAAGNFRLSEVEHIQFSIGPGIPEEARSEKHGVSIRDVRLE
jgi:hypothetical protein